MNTCKRTHVHLDPRSPCTKLHFLGFLLLYQQRALNTTGVKTVHLTAGTYYLNRVVQAPAEFNGSLKGDGQNNTSVVGVGTSGIPFLAAPVYIPLQPYPFQASAFFYFPDGFERYKYLVDQNNNIYFDPPEKWTGKGITISGTNNIIENCYIAHSWGDGLTVWGNNHTIRNNEI